MELSARERKFVESVSLGNTYTQAARDAGLELANIHYNALLRREDVREAINQQRLVNQRQLDIKREDVLQGLGEALEVAKLKEDPTAMIAAWREIGKICGFYETRVKIDVRHESEDALIKVIDQLDESQLVELANKELESIGYDDGEGEEVSRAGAKSA